MDALKPLRAEPQPESSSRKPKLELETVLAMVVTGWVATLLILTMLNAGPLWRDETNTINVAQMPSLKEMWSNMSFESFPALWLLLLRGWSMLGMADSDAGIRVLVLFIGLFFLGSLWLCRRWTGGRAPILSLALLGSLPAFIFTLGSNRAYGLAMCLLVLTFGTIWRMMQCPCRSRIIWTTVSSILFLHCLYYDGAFLCAMLFGAVLVVVRRQQWKTLAALVGIGAVAGLSMLIYIPVIRRSSPYLPLFQMPFHFQMLWGRLRQAVTAQCTAYLGAPPGPEIWIWVFLVFFGIAVAAGMQIPSFRGARKPKLENLTPIGTPNPQARADLALFSGVSMLCGSAGYICFLLKLQFPTEPWHYIGMLTLCAISLDGVLSAPWPAPRPWGLIRIGFLALMTTWGARSVSEEAQTRRSNVDLIAAVLGTKAAAGDLIVVHSAWEGITFDRYYRGRARWMTVPPIASHKVHRGDLMWEMLNQQDPMAPLLAEITGTLRNGNNVWVAGNVVLLRSGKAPPALPPPPTLPTKWWLAPYMRHWSLELMAHLAGCSEQVVTLEIPADRPVSGLENRTLLEFSGYRSGEN
jgi:hypothetical protein